MKQVEQLFIPSQLSEGNVIMEQCIHHDPNKYGVYCFDEEFYNENFNPHKDLTVIALWRYMPTNIPLQER